MSSPPSRRSRFNSRAHGGATYARRGGRRGLHVPVSIHAPTGARRALAGFQFDPGVFQFTRPRGRDRRASLHEQRGRVSIHAPTGARRVGCGPSGRGLHVSIHAPTGARPRRTSAPARPRSFNSRAHGGATPPVAAFWIASEFQFTRPRGRDISLSEPARSCLTFQFTRPRGRDSSQISPTRRKSVSIHAPTGARHADAIAAHKSDEFQFTRPRGRDACRRLRC